jgi:hypothetical protein
MQNIDELVNTVSNQIILDKLIANCSKEFLNQLEKKIEQVKFSKDVEDFLTVNLQNIDENLSNCLSSFYEKHRENFNSEEAQKDFINIIQYSSIYETVKKYFLDFFKNYLKDNPTNEIRKKSFNKILEESKIRIENSTFNSYYEYYKVLNKLVNIVFKNCTFEENSCNLLIANKNYELKFSKCTFEGEWEYIESKKTLYSDCTFDIYRHYNIAEIKEVVEDLLFYNCTFKKIICEGIHFKKQIFKNNNLYKNLQFEELSFIRCEFDKKFLITYNKSEEDKNILFEIKKLNLTDSIFHSKVEMKEIDFSKISIFNNTKFNELCDFYGSVFENIICFTKTTFQDISVFTNVIFKDDINFKYTTFGKLALFKEAVFEKKLNLEDTITKEEINFLKIKTKDNKELDFENMANRETARIIKDSFEQQNNIIEANKFYALEMKEMEKELKFFKKPFEWFVFKIHGMASNHSQDFLLALFWILNITFVTVFLQFELVCENSFVKLFDRFFFFFGGLILLGYGISKLKENFRNIAIILFSIISYFIYSNTYIDDSSLKLFSNTLNPFSIMTGKEELSFGILLYKITIAYLIYQLIISIRQNTRRK